MTSSIRTLTKSFTDVQKIFPSLACIPQLRVFTTAGIFKNYKISKNVKLVVFVPESHENVVRKALGDAGAGRIGLYDSCSFSVKGKAFFKPLNGSNPTIGSPGSLAEVNEKRIETFCKLDCINKVIAAVKKVHPYEEMGYEIQPLLEPLKPPKRKS